MFPKKHLGQHFLKDTSFAKRIVESAGNLEGKVVVEIGAGEGALTEHIVRLNPGKLVLIEIDEKLAETLSSKFPQADIICKDARKVDYTKLLDGQQAVFIGNLPYYAGAEIIRNLVFQHEAVEKGVFTLQKEVALRFAKQKGKDYGYLLSLAGLFFDFKLLFDIPPWAFFPKPEVYSSVILCVPKRVNLDRKQVLEFERFLKKAFRSRRKKLKNALGVKADLEILEKRPEELKPEELFELFLALRENHKEC